MWERWRPDRVAADLRRVRGLNANTVRLVVSPDQFGYPMPTQRYRERLAQAVGLAAAAGLHVQLTLFDWWYEYGDRAGSRTWLRELLAPYVGDARVAFVELRNEIDPADATAVAWARELVPWLRGYLRGTPVTLSVANAGSVRALRALVRGLGAASRPDFFTAHYFTGGGELARIRLPAAPSGGCADAALGRRGRLPDLEQRLRLLDPAAHSLGAGGRPVALPEDELRRAAAARPPVGRDLDSRRLRCGAIPESDVSPHEPEYSIRALSGRRLPEARGRHRAPALRRRTRAELQRRLRAVGERGGRLGAACDVGRSRTQRRWRRNATRTCLARARRRCASAREPPPTASSASRRSRRECAPAGVPSRRHGRRAGRTAGAFGS